MSIAIAGMALLPGGCEKKELAKAPTAPPPTAVTVSLPVHQQVMEWDEYEGRLAALEQVEIRARVSGFLESVHFTEGALVKKGDLLYEIDRKPFAAIYDQAVAEQQRVEAQLAYDTAELQRIEALVAAKAASLKEQENARLIQKRSSAALGGAQALVRSAQLNLDYTRLTAPISGRIGRALVTKGNLITGGATQSTLLTTIVSVDPIACYVKFDERSVLKYQRMAQTHRQAGVKDSGIACWIGLSEEKGYPHEGVIDFVNNTLDPDTGTLAARGVFPNPDGALTPGLFARMRLPGSDRYTALIIPDEAVLTDQNRKYVLVVDQSNAAHIRPIELGPLYEGMRVVTAGLNDTDHVVINGQSKIRENAVVAPNLVPMPVKGTGAGAAPQSSTTQSSATQPAATAPSAGGAREKARP